MTSVLDIAPPVLLHHLKHNKVLHERIILLSIVTEEVPQVGDAERLECRELGQGFFQVVAHYGFMESPDIPALLRRMAESDVGGLAGGGVPDADVVLPGPRDAHRHAARARRRSAPPRRPAADVLLAAPALRHHDAQRPRGDGVLQPAAESGR